MLKGHGDDGYLYNGKVVSNFSSNVYNKGVSEALKNHLKRCIDKVTNYPESNAESLQHNIAMHHELNNDQVLVTNGATEAFYLIGHAFRQTSATIVVPAFSEYEDACMVNGLKLNFIAWDDLKPDSRFETALVFIGNPNNPTGTVLTDAFLRSLLGTNPDTIFVIDEAYIDFTLAIKSATSLLDIYKNLVIVKSLTKTYAIPGLRLGYILGSGELVKKITAIKMPWSVNSLAIESGNFILRNLSAMKLPLSDLINDTLLLIKELQKYDFISVYPTHTNFFLCKTNFGNSSLLKDFLINNYGILIRDASNFRNLTPGHFRISTQTQEENMQLVKSISEWSQTL